MANTVEVESDMGWKVGFDGLGLYLVPQLSWREERELGHWSSADGADSFSLICNFIEISLE